MGHPNQTYNGMPDVSPSKHAVVGSVILCTDSKDTVRVTSAAPIGATGKVIVVDVRTRPNPFGPGGGDSVGSAYGTLSASGMAADDRTILPCRSSAPAQAPGSEVAVELSIAPGTNAAASGFRFTFTDGHDTSTLDFPLGVILCSTKVLETPSCSALSIKYSGSQ
jgi:hypothetical protein